MPVTIHVTIVRPNVGLTDTIDAPTYNASGVASLTGTVSGAVATDGSTQITGNLAVTGLLSAGSLTTGAVSATSLTANIVTAGALTSTGVVQATAGIKLGAAGVVINEVKTGGVTITVPAGNAGTVVTLAPVNVPGATAAATRLFQIAYASYGGGSIHGYTVDGADNVTLSVYRTDTRSSSITPTLVYILIR